MARRSEDKLDERFRELLRAKHEAGRRGSEVGEIEAELAELGRAWGLDAEELVDAEAVTARELGLVSEPLSRDSSAVPRAPRASAALKAVVAVLLWSLGFGGIAFGINKGFDLLLLRPAAEELCHERGWQYSDFLREDRMLVGSTCFEPGGAGPPVRHELRRGFLHESLVVDRVISIGVLLLSIALGVALPTLILSYAAGVLRRRE